VLSCDTERVTADKPYASRRFRDRASFRQKTNASSRTCPFVPPQHDRINICNQKGKCSQFVEYLPVSRRGSALKLLQMVHNDITKMNIDDSKPQPNGVASCRALKGKAA